MNKTTTGNLKSEDYKNVYDVMNKCDMAQALAFKELFDKHAGMLQNQAIEELLNNTQC